MKCIFSPTYKSAIENIYTEYTKVENNAQRMGQSQENTSGSQGQPSEKTFSTETKKYSGKLKVT
jgi:hypothetical protein